MPTVCVATVLWYKSEWNTFSFWLKSNSAMILGKGEPLCTSGVWYEAVGHHSFFFFSPLQEHCISVTLPLTNLFAGYNCVLHLALTLRSVLVRAPQELWWGEISNPSPLKPGAWSKGGQVKPQQLHVHFTRRKCLQHLGNASAASHWVKWEKGKTTPGESFFVCLGLLEAVTSCRSSQLCLQVCARCPWAIAGIMFCSCLPDD